MVQLNWINWASGESDFIFADSAPVPTPDRLEVNGLYHRFREPLPLAENTVWVLTDHSDRMWRVLADSKAFKHYKIGVTPYQLFYPLYPRLPYTFKRVKQLFMLEDLILKKLHKISHIITAKMVKSDSITSFASIANELKLVAENQNLLKGRYKLYDLVYEWIQSIHYDYVASMSSPEISSSGGNVPTRRRAPGVSEINFLIDKDDPNIVFFLNGIWLYVKRLLRGSGSTPPDSSFNIYLLTAQDEYIRIELSFSGINSKFLSLIKLIVGYQKAKAAKNEALIKSGEKVELSPKPIDDKWLAEAVEATLTEKLDEVAMREIDIVQLNRLKDKVVAETISSLETTSPTSVEDLRKIIVANIKTVAKPTISEVKKTAKKKVARREALASNNVEFTLNGSPKVFSDYLKPDSAFLDKLKEEDFFSTVDSNGFPENKRVKITNLKPIYDSNLLVPDICKAFNSLSLDPEDSLFVKKVDVKNESDEINAVNKWTVTFADINGKQFTKSILVPIPDSYGNIRLNGQRKIIHPQIIGTVVKTGPAEVTVTTWSNKSICFRKGEVTNAYLDVLLKLSSDAPDDEVKVHYGDVESSVDSDVLGFEITSLVESGITGVTFKKTNRFRFVDDSDIRKTLDLSRVKTPDDLFFFADVKISGKREIFAIRKRTTGEIVRYDGTSKSLTPVPQYKKVIDIVYTVHFSELGGNSDILESTDGVRRPANAYSVMQIFRRKIPIGLTLAYIYGLRWLLDEAKVEYAFFPEDRGERAIYGNNSTKQTELDPKIPSVRKRTEYFSDGILEYVATPSATLLLSGLSTVSINMFSFEELCEPKNPAYQQLFSTANWIRGINSLPILDSLRYLEFSFIDHVSASVLKDMNIIPTFGNLFIHVSNMLISNKTQPLSSLEGKRIRGNEAIAHSVFRNITQAYNTYRRAKRTQGSVRKVEFELKPTCVLSDLAMLPNVEVLTGLSPTIQASAMNKVGYSGIGGTNLQRAIKMEHRSYHDSMKGIFSTATSFSGNAGSVRYLTTGANLSPRGVPYSSEKFTRLNKYSPLESLSPYIFNHDDAPRTLMAYVQTEHFTSSRKGSRPLYGNGGDKVIALMSPDFAFKAAGPGKVVRVDAGKGIVEVRYDDGNTGYIDLKPNVVRNNYISFSVCAQLKASERVKPGYRFKKDEILAYDTSYFKETNDFDKGVGMTTGILVPIALYEEAGDYEDGSVISSSLSEDLSLSLVDEVTALVPKTAIIQYIADLGKDTRKTDDLLLKFQESYAEEKLTIMMQNLLSDNPEALKDAAKEVHPNYKGELIDITMLWNVPEEEMSESVAKMVKDYVKREDRGVDFSKTNDFVKTKPLKMINSNKIAGGSFSGVVVKFSIRHTRPLHQGNKANAFAPLKGIFSKILPDELMPLAEHTGQVRYYIGVESFKGRKTPSFFLMGFCNKIIVNLKKKASAYKNDPAKLSKFILSFAEAFGQRNKQKYKDWLDGMSAKAYAEWRSKFFDDEERHFLIEIEDHEHSMSELTAIAKKFDLPGMTEQLMIRHVDGVNSVLPTEAPVLWLHIRPHQQFLFKKAKISVQTKRSPVTGKLRTGSRIGHGASELDINAYTTLGLDNLAVERVLLKGDNIPAKKQMLEQIDTKGYYRLADVDIKQEDTATLNFAAAGIIGAHFGFTPYIDEATPIIPTMKDRLTRE